MAVGDELVDAREDDNIELDEATEVDFLELVELLLDFLFVVVQWGVTVLVLVDETDTVVWVV